MSGAQSHRSFIRRLVIWIAVPAGLASPFLVHGAVSSFRDWLRGVKRYDAQDGFFTLWTGVWVPHADLDLGAGTTVRIYAGAENFRGSLGYAILVNGKEFVDGCGFGALRHDLPEGHLTDLHFSVVPSADRNLIGVVEDFQPEVILIAYDHRTGLAWPHDRQSGRIQPPADDTGEEPCVHRNRNLRSWEDRIIRAFRTKDPAKGYLFVDDVTKDRRSALKVYEK